MAKSTEINVTQPQSQDLKLVNVMTNESFITKFTQTTISSIHSYTSLFYTTHESVMSINILSKNEDILEKTQSRDQIFPLVDKAYYVDTINYKIDNTEASFDNAD